MRLHGIQQGGHVHPASGVHLAHPVRGVQGCDCKGFGGLTLLRPLCDAVARGPAVIPRLTVCFVGKHLHHRHVVHQRPLHAERFFHGQQRGPHAGHMGRRVPNLDHTAKRDWVEHAGGHTRGAGLPVTPPRNSAAALGKLPGHQGPSKSPTHHHHVLAHATTPRSRPTFSKAASARSNCSWV